ncbi:calmodulin-like isoform X1 [Olea europaea subsp. europaea]|uniref:Calmodulin-like isoform X1 n=1 Tax=Olea europaea subsp. europaea TaxID=158383 RepID=A0A8S0QUD3_OLEEU|nr:calmodulin-like isoform X1 [Olea europaea subsp. europaea]
MCPSGTASGRRETTGKPNLRSAFDVLDADSDGKISHDDLRAFYGGFSGPGDSNEDDIKSMISMADFNKDGYVEYEEFEKVLNGKNGRNGRWVVMEDAFRVMDKDGDGKVGREDLKSYLKWAGFEAHDEDVEAMIRLAGGDENDGVTFQGLLKVLAF